MVREHKKIGDTSPSDELAKAALENELRDGCSDSADASHLAALARRLAADAGQVEPPDGWESVRSRILRSIPSSMSARRPVGRRWAALAACLGFMASAGAYYAYQSHLELGRLRCEIAQLEERRVPALSVHQIGESLEVFDRVSRFYDGHTSWLAMSGQDVQLGLNGQTTLAAKQRAVVVRIRFEREAASSDVTTDVITHWGVQSAFRSIVEDSHVIEYEILPLAPTPQGALVEVRMAAHGSAGRNRSDQLISTVQMRRGEGRSLGVLRVGGEDWNVTVWTQWPEETSASQPSRA